jgi:hypothetical protein
MRAANRGLCTEFLSSCQPVSACARRRAALRRRASPARAPSGRRSEALAIGATADEADEAFGPRF